MNDNPCQKERKEFKKAKDEWEQAGLNTQRFISTKPVESMKPRPLSDTVEMKVSYKQEEIAHKIYIKKLEALDKCEKKHSS